MGPQLDVRIRSQQLCLEGDRCRRATLRLCLRRRRQPGHGHLSRPEPHTVSVRGRRLAAGRHRHHRRARPTPSDLPIRCRWPRRGQRAGRRRIAAASCLLPQRTARRCRWSGQFTPLRLFCHPGRGQAHKSGQRGLRLLRQRRHADELQLLRRRERRDRLSRSPDHLRPRCTRPANQSHRGSRKRAGPHCHDHLALNAARPVVDHQAWPAPCVHLRRLGSNQRPHPHRHGDRCDAFVELRVQRKRADRADRRPAHRCCRRDAVHLRRSGQSGDRSQRARSPHPLYQLRRPWPPAGSWTQLQYDAARRLVGEVESAGHRKRYTLDIEGRIVGEEHFDASGGRTYVRNYTRDPFDRVLTESNAAGKLDKAYSYDANGNLIVQTDALGGQMRTTYGALGRAIRRTDALNATTQFEYDPRDNLVRVTDPIGVATSYAYDGLDNRTDEGSADIGSRSYGYDAAGNLRSMAWSNGRSMSRTYDALDRLVLESYGGGAAVTAYGYDGGGFGIGRLTSMSDSAGSTTWTFDAGGHVLVHSRNSGARSLVNRYAYDAAGRPASLTYPSGAVVSQSYDAAGRVSALTLNGTTLLGSVTWQPFGAPQSWIQGNGRSASRSFDRSEEHR